MDKTYKVLAWLNLVGLVVVLGVLVSRPQAPLGAQSNFSGPINSDTGYLESGATIINTSQQWVGPINTTGSVTLGSSTVGNVGGTSGEINGIRCVSQDYDPPSLGTGATSSVDITAAGFTNGTASNTVAYFVGFATSTFDIQISTNASGSATSSVASVLFRSASGTRDLGNATITVCAIDR